jgi:type VI protein secretion system component VasK
MWFLGLVGVATAFAAWSFAREFDIDGIAGASTFTVVLIIVAVIGWTVGTFLALIKPLASAIAWWFAGAAWICVAVLTNWIVLVFAIVPLVLWVIEMKSLHLPDADQQMLEIQDELDDLLEANAELLAMVSRNQPSAVASRD